MDIFCIRPKGFNIGNEAIFLGVKYFLKEVFGFLPNLISIPATAKYESHINGGLTAKTIYEINQYGNGVIVGGGNLYENNELDVDLNALHSLAVPLFLFSISRGRVYNQQGQLVDRTDKMPDEKLRGINQKAFMTFARDKVTQAYIISQGINSCALSGCPTIFLDKANLPLPKIEDGDTGLTLISIRNPSLMNIPLKKQAETISTIKSLVNYLKAQGHNVKLLCHDRRDIAFAAGFMDVEYVYLDDIYSYLSLLKSCRLMISFRLHSTLPCLSFNVPVVNISYDERAQSLMDTIGFGSWDINMITTKDVVGEVKQRIKDIDILVRLKKETQDLWRGFHKKNLEAFFSFAKEVRKSILC